MYEKMLHGKRVLYFRYAPPMTTLDQATTDRPKEPYRGAPIEQCSVFYYWWAFLRENEGYMACCENGGRGEFARLYADFGDIRDGDFFAWWRAGGRDLFCEPPFEAPHAHLTPPESFNGEREVLLTIPITGDLERTMTEVRRMLKDAMSVARKKAADAGRDVEASRARYPVHTRPVLPSLHQTLLVWQAKKRLGEGATLVQVGREAACRAAELRGGDRESATPLSANTVHRCINAARNLIVNAGQGRFPDFSDPVTGETIEFEDEPRSKISKPKKRPRDAADIE